jgi:hypothetical protein
MDSWVYARFDIVMRNLGTSLLIALSSRSSISNLLMVLLHWCHLLKVVVPLQPLLLLLYLLGGVQQRLMAPLILVLLVPALPLPG